MFGSESDPNYFGELGRLAKNYVIPLLLFENTPITRLGVEVSGFEIPHTQILEDGSKYPSSTYAYEIKQNGKRVIYAPDLGKLDEILLNHIQGADVLLMDATFWWDNELEKISGIPVTSYQLGHVPQEEAVEILRETSIRRIVFTHFNHTNPSIDPISDQRKKVENAGMETAFDGMKIVV
jgi:coenzyme PQQ biosynthesis protein B